MSKINFVLESLFNEDGRQEKQKVILEDNSITILGRDLLGIQDKRCSRKVDFFERKY